MSRRAGRWVCKSAAAAPSAERFCEIRIALRALRCKPAAQRICCCCGFKSAGLLLLLLLFQICESSEFESDAAAALCAPARS